MSRINFIILCLIVSISSKAQNTTVLYESFDGLNFNESVYNELDVAEASSVFGHEDDFDTPSLIEYSNKQVGYYPAIGHKCICVGTETEPRKFAIPVDFSTKSQVILTFRMAPLSSSGILNCRVLNSFTAKFASRWVDGKQIKGSLSEYELEPGKWHDIKIVYSGVKKGELDFTSRVVDNDANKLSGKTDPRFLLDDIKLQVADKPATIRYSETNTNTFAAKKNANVRLERVLSPDYWNTFCVPFSLTRGQVTEFLGKNVSVEEFVGAADGALKFSKTDRIEAGKPYLVKHEKKIASPLFEGVEIVPDAPQTIEFNGYKINGNYNKLKVPQDSNSYYLTVDGALKPMADVNYLLNGFRFFVTLPEDEEEAKILTDAVVTGISSRNITKVRTNTAVYNLMGQKVTPSHHGIYIQNGRKVLK